VKQLLPAEAHSDIAQKHPASRFILTTGRGGQWEPTDEGETEMTEVAVTNPSEMRELTIDELDAAGGGMLGLLLFAIGFGIGWAAEAWYHS
jgi:hypothetical protein